MFLCDLTSTHVDVVKSVCTTAYDKNTSKYFYKDEELQTQSFQAELPRETIGTELLLASLQYIRVKKCSIVFCLSTANLHPRNIRYI